jgi:hypothetical protein
MHRLYFLRGWARVLKHWRIKLLPSNEARWSMSIAEKHTCKSFGSIDVHATLVLGQNFLIINTVLVNQNAIYYKHNIRLCMMLHILILGVIIRHECIAYIRKEVGYTEFTFIRKRYFSHDFMYHNCTVFDPYTLRVLGLQQKVSESLRITGRNKVQQHQSNMP